MSLEIAFGLIGAIIFLGLIGQMTFDRTGVPEPLILMIIGLIIGPIMHWVPSEALEPAAPLFGTLALILILFEGGMGLEIQKILSGFRQATLLMLGSGLACTCLLAFVAHEALLVDWLTAFLFGTIFAGAPSGVIAIPLVNRLKVPDRIKTIVNLEASFSDVICVVTSVVLIRLIVDGADAGGQAAWITIVHNFVLAGAIGFPAGIIWLWTLEKELQDRPLSYVMTLGVLMLLFSFTGLVGGSGAIAVLCFGIAMANGQPIINKISRSSELMRLSWRLSSAEGEKVRDIHAEISFLVRTFFFVYMGVVARIAYGGWFYLLTVVAFIGAIFLARYGSLRLFELVFPRQEQYRNLYLAMIPRGLAAAVLAGMPAAEGIAGADVFIDFGFALIFLTNLYTTIGVYLLKREQNLPDDAPRPHFRFASRSKKPY
jgi:cell volume regulation protein A